MRHSPKDKPSAFNRRRGFIAEAWFRSASPVQLPRVVLDQEITAIYDSLKGDAEKQQRFDLMARLFTKAIAFQPSEEQFILLWTVLEVFPMMDTTNIKPIAALLEHAVGLPADLVKRRLDLGGLYRKRCDLVHNGTMNLEQHEIGLLISKLEAVCSEVLRLVLGLPYSGGLDRYLEP